MQPSNACEMVVLPLPAAHDGDCDTYAQLKYALADAPTQNAPTQSDAVGAPMPLHTTLKLTAEAPRGEVGDATRTAGELLGVGVLLGVREVVRVPLGVGVGVDVDETDVVALPVADGDTPLDSDADDDAVGLGVLEILGVPVDVGV